MSLFKEARRKASEDTENSGNETSVEKEVSTFDRLPLPPVVMTIIASVVGFFLAFWIGVWFGPWLAGYVQTVIHTFL